MSLIQVDFSEDLRRERLDLFLANGWFRSSFLMYKSAILCLNGGITSVINIRLDLPNHEYKKRHRKLLRRNAKKFHVVVSKAEVSDEADELYQLNKYKFKGFIHPTLHGYLYAQATYTPFDTFQVEVFDEEKLVAISFIDVGNNSMASILGLYHPDYLKDSLGIYTMLLEIEEAKKQGIDLYYPGYVVDGDESFNYKLGLGNFQVMQESGSWVDMNAIDYDFFLGRKLDRKTDIILESIEEITREKSNVFYYPNFSFGHMEPYMSDGFLDKPLFIRLSNSVDSSFIVSFNLLSDKFSIERIVDEPDIKELLNSDISKEYKEDPNCWMGLIRVEPLVEFSKVEELKFHLKLLA